MIGTRGTRTSGATIRLYSRAAYLWGIDNPHSVGKGVGVKEKTPCH